MRNRFDLKSFRDRFAARTERGLSAAASRLEKLPPLTVLLERVPRLRWPAIAVAGFLTADLVMLAVGVYVFKPKRAPTPPPRVEEDPSYVRGRSTYEAIVTRNLFCPGCAVPDIKALALSRPKDCNKARPVQGGMKIVGTIVLSDPQFSVATVTDGGAEATALRRGDNFKQYGHVFEIRRNRICFEGPDGLLTFAEMPEDQIKFGQPLPTAMAPTGPSVDGITRLSDTDTEIKRSFLVEKLNDPNILFQAHAVPAKDPSGNIMGFKILSIVPGSVYENLGLQAGDTIKGVDGNPMNSVSRAQELYAAASTASEVAIEIERNGQSITKRFKVK